MHFVFSRFEVDIAEWHKRTGRQAGELYEQTSVAPKPFEIYIALTVEVIAHLFDLEVSHVVKSAA